jgi:glycosyltransferase involved in cell wall biosynthesis
VPREKLVRIPIPVDLDIFRPIGEAERYAARAHYGVPKGHLVIGSFQKDGVGWGKGEEPKLIKGPDVFLEVVARVACERPVFVLLTGPARGYVKRGLERLGVPYAHDFIEDYETLPRCYAALDVYLNSSAEEGGPKGIIESMASGIPVVSTRVGMAPDLIVSGQTGFLAEPGDPAALARAVLSIASDVDLRARMIPKAHEAVRICGTQAVGRAHWEKIVQPLLAELGRGRRSAGT